MLQNDFLVISAAKIQKKSDRVYKLCVKFQLNLSNLWIVLPLYPPLKIELLIFFLRNLSVLDSFDRVMDGFTDSFCVFTLGYSLWCIHSQHHVIPPIFIIVYIILQSYAFSLKLPRISGFYLKKLFLDATQSPCKGALMIAIITRAYGA